MKEAKTRSFALRMTDEEFYLLGQLAIQESVRLKEQVNRAGWIRRKISSEAKGKGLLTSKERK